MRTMHAAAVLLTLAGTPPAFAADVWHATRTLQPGDVVQPTDIVATTPKRPVLDAVSADRSVVGLEVKRRIYDGRVLTDRDVGPRDAVKANTMVDVIWREGGLELAMNGRAMEPGAIGQQIRVLNTDTSRTIRGTVVGDGMVEMGNIQQEMSLRTLSLPFALGCAVLLSGCDTFDHIQKPPNFSSPGTMGAIPPTAQSAANVAAADVPPLPPAAQGSLWQQGSKTFFRDPRARATGDLLTVAVNLQEQAEFANQTTLSRASANGMTISNLFGLGTLIGRLIPGLKDTDPTINTTGSTSTQGQGDIKRSENLVVNVATTVVQVLPNKNLEIAGSQEIRLNNELRQLQIRGIVRPEDIHSDNTITSDKIAEARIAYGGQGVSSDLQRPTWGQDLLTRFQPF